MTRLISRFLETNIRSATTGSKQKEGCEKARGQPNISTLPFELTLEIADYLSPADTACLSLCTRGLLATLGGSRHYPSLLAGESRNEQELALFLATLSRDLSGHFFCPYCCRLHSSSRVWAPGPAFRRSKGLSCLYYKRQIKVDERANARFPYRGYRLYFAHVNLALKRQWFGPNHGISTESLALTSVCRRYGEQDTGKRCTRLWSVEARVCPQPTTTLCLRAQSWVVMSTTDISKIFRCAKQMCLCGPLRSDLSNFLFQSESPNERLESGEYQGVPAVFKCPARDAEAQLEVRELPGEGTAVVFTRWIDLGDGITPPAVAWDFKDPELHRDRPLTSRDTGDARFRFESQPGCSLNCLSRRNASLLTGSAYMKELDHWNFGLWILQGKRRLPFLSSVLRQMVYYAFESGWWGRRE